jgi:hypothetical protein
MKFQTDLLLNKTSITTTSDKEVDAYIAEAA